MSSFTFFISVAGILYSVTVATYSVSDFEIKSIDAMHQQAFDDFFVLLNAGISIAAWLLFISTSGATTPSVAALFILAEAVFVIKELIILSLLRLYQAPSFNRDATHDIQHQQARLAIEVRAKDEAAWVSLLSALLLTGITAGWCIVPDSLIAGALSLIAMGFVYWKKEDETALIDAQMKKAIQAIVNDLTPWWIESPSLQTTDEVDLMASDDGLHERDQGDDWPYRDAAVSGVISQVGLFSRTLETKAGNDACVSNHQDGHHALNSNITYYHGHR